MDYRQGIVYYYSGTGNSRRVAVWVCEALAAAGCDVTLAPIQCAHPADEVGHDEGVVLGLVMPTHAFTAPWPVLRFVLRLPRRPRAHAVVLATRGGLKIGRLHTPGFEGTATLLVASVLAAKGYSIRATAGIDMPSNWTVLHPGLPPRAVETIIKRARRKTAQLSAGIFAGRRRLSNPLASLLGILMLPVSLSYLLLGRLFLAKLFFASDSCTSCGTCADFCPHRGIALHADEPGARPYWTFRCRSCMRCMAFCPTQAVEASHSLALAALVLAGSLPTGALVAWLTGRIPSLRAWRKTLRRVIAGIGAVAILAAVYPLFQALLKIRPSSRLCTRATPTPRYRRYHEPATEPHELNRREEWTSKT